MPPTSNKPSFQPAVNSIYNGESTEAYKLEQARIFAVNTSILHCTGSPSHYSKTRRKKKPILQKTEM